MALLFAALVGAVYHMFGEVAGVAMATVGLAPEGALGEVKTLLLQSKESIEKFTKSVEDRVKAMEGGFVAVKDLPDELAKIRSDLDAVRRAQSYQKTIRATKPGHVSDECARAIAATALLSADSFGGLKGYDSRNRETLLGLSREILGINTKAALTSSDIPLPTDFGGEVVELVSMFGAARQYGTVFPLGVGQTKLPRRGTDPTFGLIAVSGAVTEKSPTVVFVTFNAEKFGGLVRLPSEIDGDSIVAMGQFIARYSARQLAYLEDYNFFAGTGAGSGINGSVAGLTSSTITNTKVTQMASTKTKYSDATLANIRSIRAVVDAPIIGKGAYYMRPTFEQHLAGLNTAGDKPYQANGLNGATLDGFPIRWVDVMPAYSTSANVSKVFMLFGDPSYQYLGVRQGVSVETSRDVFFATDELAVRALERFTIGLMATGAVAGLQTAAS